MKKTAQPIEPNEYILVKKEFTSKTSYRSLAKTAERREIVFNEFVSLVRCQYNHMKEDCAKLRDRDYLIFNEYISDAFDMLNQCWSDGMIKFCNQRLKVVDDLIHNPQFQQSLPLECTQYESERFESMQQQLLEHIKESQSQTQVFLDSVDKYNQDRQKTLNYFNPNYLKQPYVQMSKLYHYLQESDHKNKKLISKCEKSKIKFLSIFNNFRRIAVKNRMLFEKKFYKACNILVDSIIKTFNELLNKLKRIKEELKRQEESINNSQAKQKNEYFNKATSEDLFSICQCSKAIYTMIYDIMKKCKYQRDKFNKKICELMKVQDSIPSHALNFVLETFEKMLGRKIQIANNLFVKVKTLQVQQAKLNDYNSTTTASNLQSGIRKTKLSNIQKTLTIPGVINQIIDEMIDPLSKLVSWGETTLAKQRKIYLDDEHLNHHHDMTKLSIDNVQEQVHEEDMWMFQDWKSPNSIKSPSISKCKDELSKMKALIESQKKTEGREVMEPQKCQLSVSPSYDKKGVFYTYQNCVKFISSQDNQILVIPYESINNVKVKLQVFKLNMFLYTPRGRICFINPPRAIKCKQKISERIKNKNNDSGDADDGGNTNVDQLGSAGGNVPKWKSVELTPGELSGMDARKTKILAQLPDTSSWNQMHPNHVFKNVGIDQLFYQLYNDNPKQIGGKKWNSFNFYLLNVLGGNQNIQVGKFTSKGPKFYTQQDGQTFESCPSFSQRINNYEHVLEGFPLPFLPKFCKCKQVTKIYWISNQQFAMSLDAYSSGVPMTDSFYVRMVHHAKKNGDDVQISYRATVVFVKETSFKSMLQKKCLQEIRDNLPKTLKFQQNRLRFVTSIAKGGDVVQQILPASISAKQQNGNSTSSSSSNNNVMLIILGVIGFLIIIKLLKMIFL